MTTLPVDFVNRENRLYKCYQELLRWIPQLRPVFAHSNGVRLDKIFKAVGLKSN